MRYGMADGQNLQLYTTKTNGIDVLADVKTGNGNIYFCKGLENAQAILEDTIISDFKTYLDENLLGCWMIWDPQNEDRMDYIDFTSDELILITQSGGTVINCPISEVTYGVSENKPYAEFWVQWAESGDPIALVITPAHDNYKEAHELYMDGDRLLLKE